MVGSWGWESMANALCNVGLSLGFSKFLVLPLPVTVIHLSSLFSPSFFAYPPKSAVSLMRGLDATSCSSQINVALLSVAFSPSLFAYPPLSAVRLMHGVDTKAIVRLMHGVDAYFNSLSHIDLKWCLLYFLIH